MSLNKIIDELKDVRPEAFEVKNDRRNILKSFGAKVALVSIPVLGSTIFKKANAQSKATIIEILNRLLKLEHFKAELYSIATSTPGVIDAADLEAFERIAADQASHVTVISQIIIDLDGVPIAKPSSFDTSGGSGSGNGGFKNSDSDPRVFIKLAQVLADFSVRAYKGMISQLTSDKPALQAAINIHSSEARTASYIRRKREITGWITGSISGVDIPDAQVVYGREEETNQYGIELVGINGFDIKANAASESFDESFNELEIDAYIARFVP